MTQIQYRWCGKRTQVWGYEGVLMNGAGEVLMIVTDLIIGISSCQKHQDISIFYLGILLGQSAENRINYKNFKNTKHSDYDRVSISSIVLKIQDIMTIMKSEHFNHF